MTTVAPTAPGLRVLVADDDPLNLRVAARLLRDLGHGGVMVTNGQKALVALGSQAFDLVLLDIQMPELNGHDTLCAIRQLPGAGRRVPVVMMSGESGSDTRQAYLAAGADAYLVKPLSVAALTDVLRQLRLG